MGRFNLAKAMPDECRYPILILVGDKNYSEFVPDVIGGITSSSCLSFSKPEYSRLIHIGLVHYGMVLSAEISFRLWNTPPEGTFIYTS